MVATADNNFIVDAGLRWEYAFDSKTISPVLTSSRATDGLLSSGATASLEKTLAADIGSKACALGATKSAPDNRAAENHDMRFIRKVLVPERCDKDIKNG